MKFFVAIIFLATCCDQTLSQSSAAEKHTSIYPTSAAEELTRTRELHYTYLRSDFTPPFRLLPADGPASSFATPEDVMRTRALAMEQSNFDVWLKTWDVPSQIMFQQEYQKPGALERQKNLWHAFFSRGQQVLFKRIENRGYVILTYRVMTPQGTDIGGLELPSVFHKVGDQWLGTQDLASDPLFFESPWMSGKERAEREAK